MMDPKEFRYMKSHEWVSLAEGTAVVGISEHAQREITDVVFVELPKAGRKVRQGEAMAVVESVKAAFDIYAPVSGEVAAVNQEVVANPALVNQSPHERGWLVKIKASDPSETGALMDQAQYEEFLKTAAH